MRSAAGLVVRRGGDANLSRSKHTRPRAILAASRRRDPYAPRGLGDPSARDALGRALKERGLDVASPGAARAIAPAAPRLSAQRPRPGRHHPADCAAIRRLLARCGEECLYGLRSIELRQGAPAAAGRLSFGRLLTPGRIILFDQPRSPWRLPGALDEASRARFGRFGAEIEVTADGAQTIVAWPDAALRDFMLLDVLLHELGHHVLQHYTGKRRARIARTRDHEAFAERFAERWRERIGAADGGLGR